MIESVRLPIRRPNPMRDGFRLWTTAMALLVPLILLLIVGVLIQQSAPALKQYGLSFLVTRTWNPVTEQFGALPMIYGTVVSAGLALLLALPVGVGAAIFLAEPGAATARSVIGIGVELLAAIPSVVYGIWGLYVLAPMLQKYVMIPVSLHLGWLPIFKGPPFSSSMFSAAVVVAVMILPTLAAVSRDVIKAVPHSLREASHALGATWWETVWKVVLPAARAGIVGATVLALGRALGETIAVTMVIGNRPDINPSIFQPAYTLASVIANEFGEATGTLYTAALVELGVVLVLVTVTVNLGALLLVRRTGRQV